MPWLIVNVIVALAVAYLEGSPDGSPMLAVAHRTLAELGAPPTSTAPNVSDPPARMADPRPNDPPPEAP